MRPGKRKEETNERHHKGIADDDDETGVVVPHALCSLSSLSCSSRT